MKSSENVKAHEKSFKLIYNLKEFFSNPKIKYGVLIILMLIISFSVQYFLNRPNFGVFLSSDMDPSNNVYVLGVDKDKDQYKITKVSPNGKTEFQIDLEKSNEDNAYIYSNLEVDSKGNFYLVKQKKNLKAVVVNKSMYPTVSETVLMYDTNGNYIKQLAAMDFSKNATPPTEPYIRKIQIVDQKITLIGLENDKCDIITVNPLTTESPKKVKTFNITRGGALTNQKYNWVSDVAVLSTGRIYYSTLNGELYATNNEGNFENCSNILSSNSSFQLTGISVDEEDNIYFNDCVNGKFYKLNTRSSLATELYDLESNVYQDQKMNKNIKLKDLKNIKVLSTGDFYAPCKAFDKPYYVRFGTQSHFTGDIRGKLMPWGCVIMLITAILLISLFYLIKFIMNFEIVRIPLSLRILTLFLPLFLISMLSLVWVNTSDGVNEYMKSLRNQQANAAKIAADVLNENNFSKINHLSDYMNSDYIKIKNDLQKSYSNIYSNIGDKSDYLITYIEKNGKLYSTISTKYDVNSDSYNTLKYTSPDIFPQQYALVDCILERDECESIYNLWKKLSDKSKNLESSNMNFRDVYGNISATFVPIKDSNGSIVGMVGNYLDESLHTKQEFLEILKHASALILIITVLISLYICFVIKWCLKPLKTIEKAIDTTAKGQWDTRIKIKTKDELADIAQAFNLMSEKIQRYTDNLIRLNKEYIRYVPQELFKFMGKEKITQVDLYTHKLVKMSMVYISFNISCKECFDFNKENDIFEAINTSYKEIFKIVQINKGVVQSFSGLDAVILFPNSKEDAINASSQFKEVNIPEQIKQRMHITVGTGDALIGVSGNNERRGVIIVSDKILQLFNIDNKMSILGINHIATENIIKHIDKDFPIIYRYIGRALSPVDSTYENIYQIIDVNKSYQKDLYISTKEQFEYAVKLYIEKNYEKARNIFADVLKFNENDKVSIKYLMMCENQINKKPYISDSFHNDEFII